MLDVLGVLRDIKTKLFRWRLLVRVYKSLMEREDLGAEEKWKGW